MPRTIEQAQDRTSGARIGAAALGVVAVALLVGVLRELGMAAGDEDLGWVLVLFFVGLPLAVFGLFFFGATALAVVGVANRTPERREASRRRAVACGDVGVILAALYLSGGLVPEGVVVGVASLVASVTLRRL